MGKLKGLSLAPGATSRYIIIRFNQGRYEGLLGNTSALEYHAKYNAALPSKWENVNDPGQEFDWPFAKPGDPVPTSQVEFIEMIRFGNEGDPGFRIDTHHFKRWPVCTDGVGLEHDYTVPIGPFEVLSAESVQTTYQALQDGLEELEQLLEEAENGTSLLLSAIEGAQNAALLPSKIGTLVDSITSRGSNGAFLNVQNSAGTFYGWAGYCGVRGSFNRVTPEVYPFDAGLMPTQIRVVVRDGGPAGAILGDITVPLSGLTLNQRKAVTVEYPAVINHPGGIWLETITNGRIALVNSGSTLYSGDPNWHRVQYWAGAPTLTPGAGTDANTIYGIMASFELITYNASINLDAGFKNQIGDTMAEPAQLAKLPLVERQRELIAPATVNVMPTLGAVGANQYGTVLGAGWYAWGKKFTPGAVTFNLVGVMPANPISDNGKVAVVIKNSTQTAVLAVSYDLTAAEWNAAFQNGKEIKALLQTPVTVAAGTQIMVYYHAYGEKISHWSMTTPAEVAAERYFISATGGVIWNNATLGLATNQSVYFRLYYSAAAQYKNYAAPNPNSSLSTAVPLTDIFGNTDILLPSQLYVLKAAGEQFSLYHKNVTMGRWHETQLFDWAANYGKQLVECWRIEPQEQAVPLGAFALTFSLWNAQLVVQATKAVTVNVISKTGVVTPSDFTAIGDSITFRADYLEQVVATLTGITARGIRKVRNVFLEGRGGWKLTGSTVSYWQAGAADGTDSPFMFPVGVSATNYRGNVEFWKRAVQVDNGTITAASDATTEYAFRGFGTAAKEGGATYQYDAATGYPFTPTLGWVVYDPAKAAGSRFQEWNGAAWVAMASQPASWDFDFVKYLARYAWAYPNGAPRHVFILLGANDFANTAGDPDFTAWIASYETTVQRIQAASANTRVLIGLPSITSDADGTGDLYGAGLNTERMRRNYQLASKALIEKFDTAGFRAANVHLVPFGLGIDPEYGFSQSTLQAPNKYITDAALFIRRNKDGIHPETPGAKQGGDWVAGTTQATR